MIEQLTKWIDQFEKVFKEKPREIKIGVSLFETMKGIMEDATGIDITQNKFEFHGIIISCQEWIL